jgi:hypothetical protein
VGVYWIALGVHYLHLLAEALICTHNWLKNRLSDEELEEFLTEFDELGKCL